jgi:uncharacterized small protein (DUF1192 family)
MVDTVQSAMFEILKGIQADIADLKQNVATDFATVHARLDKIEANQKKARRDAAGLLVLFRNAVGEYEERVSSLEAAMDRWKD